MLKINWDQINAEAVQHLQALVRLDTSNPPGNELPAAEYLAGVLTREGLTPLILQSAPRRANLVVRLTGQGAQPPLMLMSHLDVVPVDASQWSHPPFGGDLIDGRVWGRGSLDDKLVTVADLMTILLCHRLRLPLRGDLVMLAHADEESDFTYGITWLVREHRDLFDAPYALYEGGAVMEIGGQDFVLVDSAEKGWCTIQVTALGAGGHSAIPHPDNPLYHLTPALTRLATHKMPVHRVETVSQLFMGLADRLSPTRPDLAGPFQRLAEPSTAEAALATLPVETYLRHRFDALLRNTAAPTVFTSGINRWSLPREARMTVNGRLLPGQTATDFEREWQALIGPGVAYDIQDLHEGAECPRETPLMVSIRRVVGRRFANARIVPNMLTGGTERGLLQTLGVQVYGFCPLYEEPGQPPPFSLAHAPDERVSVRNLTENCQALFEIVCDFNNCRLSP